jgi:anti-sigma factor (TIGR02949 family)
MSNDDQHHSMDDDCLDAMDHLYEYLNGEITDKEMITMMEHHLGHCRSCFSRAEFERSLNEKLKESGKEKTPKAFQNRLKSLIDNF